VKRSQVIALLCVSLLTFVMVTGCGGSNAGPSDAKYQKSRSALIRQLEALPGATVTAHVESSVEEGRGNVTADAVLPKTASTAQVNAMADSLERTIWLSHLDPLGRIGLNLSLQGSSVRVLQRLYQSDTKPLREKYGPRPDGLGPS
jgi:hypothetical protein